MMSSGINWRYTISGGGDDAPPIKYSVGVAWASGMASEMIVTVSAGLDSVRTAYSLLPGLGYHRQLWLTEKMTGYKMVAEAAAKYLVGLAVARRGKKSPLIYVPADIETLPVSRWITDNAVTCGDEILSFAGIDPSTPFLECWEELAIAAYEWPRHRWGVCPDRPRLGVYSCGDAPERLPDDAASELLTIVEQWGRSFDPRSGAERANVSMMESLDQFRDRRAARGLPAA